MEDHEDRYQRQLPDPATSSVSRCLFGVSNPETNKDFAQIYLTEHRQSMKSKYNFDFDNETPLKGRFAWEIIHPAPGNQIPSFYQSRTFVRGRRTLSDINLYANGHQSSSGDNQCNDQRSLQQLSSQVTQLQQPNPAAAPHRSQTAARCSQEGESTGAGFDEIVAQTSKAARKRYITGA